MTVIEFGIMLKLELVVVALTRVSFTMDFVKMLPLAQNSRLEFVTTEPLLKSNQNKILVE